MFKSSLLSIIVVSSAAACGGSQSVGTPHEVAGAQPAKEVSPASVPVDFPLAEQAKAGVDSAELQALLVQHWDERMRSSPVWASTLGDHRFDDKLADGTRDSILAQRAQVASLLATARGIDTKVLSARDKITHALFVEGLSRQVDNEQCERFLWTVSARNNPINSVNQMARDHVVGDRQAAENLLERYRQIPGMVDTQIENLRLGLAQGRVANAESIRRTVKLVDGQLQTSLAEWTLNKPHSVVASVAGEAMADELRALVGGDIKQAFTRYRDVLKNELLPAGRSGKNVGVHALPNGLACYEASIRGHINLDRTADEIHQVGLREIARINREMAVLGKTLFKTKSLGATIKRLRTDKSLYYSNKEEIVQKAESALAKARYAIPKFFGILPKEDCTVVEIPAVQAPYTTIAYYQQPQASSGKPGQYFINTYQPKTRPRFEMEVLAYHESIPGHHLQIAISLERDNLPLFRKHGGSTAFVEGWALYTERLADEMGLYSGDLDRMGMLSYDAWRASRLVVDTGIHAKGWTREQAETFMQKHTALTKANIANEVDRYISWPGQAVAYKTGQLEILRLRKLAQSELGEAFAIAAFHDTVLRQGAVTLPVLESQVRAWIASLQ